MAKAGDTLRIYVGPEVRKYGIRYSDAWNDSETQQEAVRACPSIASLFIPIDELPAHRSQLTQQGSKLQQLSSNVTQRVVQWTKALTPKANPMPSKKRK